MCREGTEILRSITGARTNMWGGLFVEDNSNERNTQAIDFCLISCPLQTAMDTNYEVYFHFDGSCYVCSSLPVVFA